MGYQHGYQVSRWYDRDPRLGFAMQLMQLSPAEVQAAATDVLDTLLADFTAEAPMSRLDTGKRWYDRVARAPGVFERLKASPQSLQKTAAEALLAFFDQSR